MGANFLTQQVENFQRGRDRAVSQLEQPTLFDLPDVLSTTYTIQPFNGCALEVDASLFVIRESGEVTLAQGHRKVALFVGESAKALEKVLEGESNPEAVRLRITEVSQLSGVGKARIVKEKNVG